MAFILEAYIFTVTSNKALKMYSLQKPIFVSGMQL